MKCVPVNLDEYTVTQIDLIAAHQGLSRAAVIRGVVEDYIERETNRSRAVYAKCLDKLTQTRRTGG